MNPNGPVVRVLYENYRHLDMLEHEASLMVMESTERLRLLRGQRITAWAAYNDARLCEHSNDPNVATQNKKT